jgi:hypothetical protein
MQPNIEKKRREAGFRGDAGAGRVLSIVVFLTMIAYVAR